MPTLEDFFHEGDEKLNRTGYKKLARSAERLQKQHKESQDRLKEKQKRYLSPENDDLWDDF